MCINFIFKTVIFLFCYRGNTLFTQKLCNRHDHVVTVVLVIVYWKIVLSKYGHVKIRKIKRILIRTITIIICLCFWWFLGQQ